MEYDMIINVLNLLGIPSLILLLIQQLLKQHKTDKKVYQSIIEAQIATLRDRITQMHTHYMKLGYIPSLARRNLHSMYKAYKDLGGNEDVDTMFEELNELDGKIDEDYR